MYKPAGFVGAMAIMLLQAAAWAAEPVAVITEIRVGKGEVRVKRAGEADWKAPQPLLSLRPGDQVRVAGDAQAVLVFTGGRGSQTVSSANSPLTVQAPTGQTGAEQVRTLLANVTQFLLGQQKEQTYQSLSVRSIRQPPVILSPRETRLLPGPVTFEWSGSELLRYEIRVLGPQGALLWKETNLARQPLAYPTSAPPLPEGVRHVWELGAKGFPPQRASFEILSNSEASRLQNTLALLQGGMQAGYPKNTVTLMRAALFFREGLYHEARRELQAAITAEPDEPTLHLLLGQVYDRTGLKDLARQEFDEAQFLSTSKP
jgi:hypothetical protein